MSAGRRLFVCKAEVVAVEDGEERACANLLQTVSLSPVGPEQRLLGGAPGLPIFPTQGGARPVSDALRGSLGWRWIPWLKPVLLEA